MVSMAQLDDRVVAAQAGDKEAYADVVRLTQPALRSFLALRLLDLELLEEVEQAVYVQAYLSLERYEPRGTFVSWLCGFGRNLAAAQLRQRYRHRADDGLLALLVDDALTDPKEALEVADGRLQQQDLIRSCLSELAPEARGLIEARYFNEQEVADIAAERGRSRNWVSVNLMRIRRSLRSCLQNKGVVT